MLNIPVSSVKLSKKSKFDDSLLEKPQLLIMITHIIEMSKKSGEWIYEFSMDEFLKDFKPNPLSFPYKFSIWSYMLQLQLEGYVRISSDEKSIRITKKFEKLCEENSKVYKKFR